jgi:hypothetical protein
MSRVLFQDGDGLSDQCVVWQHIRVPEPQVLAHSQLGSLVAAVVAVTQLTSLGRALEVSGLEERVAGNLIATIEPVEAHHYLEVSTGLLSKEVKCPVEEGDVGWSAGDTKANVRHVGTLPHVLEEGKPRISHWAMRSGAKDQAAGVMVMRPMALSSVVN